MIPYGKQSINQTDIDAVVEVLSGDWLTQGPKSREFEQAFCGYVGVREAVTVCNGTAALHAAMHAIGIGAGDEVLVPAMTFAASANCVVYVGGTPKFVDVDSETLLIDPSQVEAAISPRTKAILAVDYAGQPCDYEALLALAKTHNLTVVADSCHALGARRGDRNAGSIADLSVFSFHPVKPITTAEGGMAVTNSSVFADKMRSFRNHGIDADLHQRASGDTWYYEISELGYNYRLSDLQCALGISQLRRLPVWIERRQSIASQYDDAFGGHPLISPLTVAPDVSHARHLYVIKLELEKLTASRRTVFSDLRGEGIGVNVHYVPVHLHPFYRREFGAKPGLCPVAESVYERILSLPIYPGMDDHEVTRVIDTVLKVVGKYKS